ncbi:unnamed protein product [Taenia asiatica]|uniref:Uncharacterized protein n=1 Tax=Taenia asiatica TaxID=60517 RepID=A0A0R3WG90_TAEAS|nr:unnamed protein product [Taenia asiatica]
MIFAISQSQAFFTLLDSELLADRERRPDGVAGREVEEPAEVEAAAEHQEGGEVIEPVGVTQRDITLLRRDILISLERLRRMLERQFNMRPLQPLNLRYPDELVFAIAQSQAFYTLLDNELFAERERHPTEMAEREAEEPVETEAAESVGVTHRDILLLRRDITLMRRDVIIALERLRRTLERQMNLGAYWPFNVSGQSPYYPSSRQ